MGGPSEDEAYRLSRNISDAHAEIESLTTRLPSGGHDFPSTGSDEHSVRPTARGVLGRGAFLLARHGAVLSNLETYPLTPKPAVFNP